MSKEAKRERVDDISKCDTPASVGEYLEDNPFREVNFINGLPIHIQDTLSKTHKLLEYALYKPTNLNFTQYQLTLQSLGEQGGVDKRAYAVLLRIMEIRFSLDRLDL